MPPEVFVCICKMCGVLFNLDKTSICPVCNYDNASCPTMIAEVTIR